jgi:putative ABC transport system substrate-binding protein
MNISIPFPNATAMRFVAALLSVSIFMSSWGAAIAAQQSTKTYRVGVMGIMSTPTPESRRIWDAFLAGLRELGYIEGKNLSFELRYSEGRADRFRALAQELVLLNVDMIVVWTTPAALAARAATRTIPILFVTAIDPVGAGIAESLARPGGNVTGLAMMSPELSAKRLELLKEALPHLSHVAVLLNAANPGNLLTLRHTEEAARRLAIAIRRYEVRTPDDIASSLTEIGAERPDALLVLADAMTFARRKELAEFALAAHLPSSFESREMAVAGGLFAYGPNYIQQFHRAAFYADKLLKGAKPADLPFDQETKFELVVNMKTARMLGLKLPQSILLRADEVLE